MNQEQSNDATIVKLQSDQFIIPPLPETKAIAGDSQEFTVDLARQSCQCKDFEGHRKSLPIGDPRRFCRHMVQARCETNLHDLPPFLQSLLEVHETNGCGLPNGATFSFFEIDGRLCFFGDNRDHSTYFFLTGLSQGIFHEFVYDRKTKSWADGHAPDSADRLMVFVFKERGQYVTPARSADGSSRSRQRSKRIRKRDVQYKDTPAGIKYLILLLVAAGLIAGGYYLFKDGTPDWLANLVGIESPEEETEKSELPTDEEMIAFHKENSAQQGSDLKAEFEKNKDANQNNKEPASDLETAESDAKMSPLEESPKVAEDDEPEKKPLEFREWNTADQEFSVMARYVSYQNGTITLEREDNNEKVKIEESQLCLDDQSYVKQVRRDRRIQRARDKKVKASESETQQ